MPEDDDFLDSCCEGFDRLHLRDEDVVWVVLFADIDRNDPQAVQRRVDEWAELFGA